MTNWITRLSHFRSLGAAAAITFVGALIFWDFLFCDALLLYKDIGADSLLSYYPEFVHLSHYVRTAGYPSWSFCVGMGQDLAYLAGYLFWQPVTWLPKAWIAYAFVYQHLAKALLAGLLFCRFLQLRGVASSASILGSLLLAFSGYMTIGSCWYPLADEVVAFAAVLLGTEKAIQNGRWLMLVLAVAAVGLLNPFFLYLCALFLACYVPLRLFAAQGWQPKLILRACAALAALASLGVAFGAAITLPYLYVILSSPRGVGTTSASTPFLAVPIFRLESTRHYLTALYRSMSNDIIGAGDHFHAWGNYLEAPLPYCGLVCLLLVPQVFRGGSRRSRTIASLVLFALIVPTVFPWFRHLFWLFQGNYYRTYSLFWILVVITFSMVVFSRYFGGFKLSLFLLGGTTATWLSVLFVPIANSRTLLDPNLRIATAAYLLVYTSLLVAGQLMGRQRLAGYAVIAVAAVELIHFNRISVGHRDFVTKSELQSRTGYNDETVDAIRDLQAEDQSFFRITKPRPAVILRVIALNDALVFSYYGTSSYSSFNNVNYTDFLTAAGEVMANSETDTRWAIGTLNNPLLSTFVGEKYALVDDPGFVRDTLSYRFVRQYGPNYLFYNQLFVPLGLTFERYITEADFLQMSTTDRVQAVLRAVVLGQDAERAKDGLTAVLIPELTSEINDLPVEQVIASRRASGLHLTSFQQSKLEGTIYLERKSIVVLQTPFDRGWRAWSNDKAVPVIKADVGLLGAVLEAGDHRIVFRYRNPYLLPGILLSLAALLLCPVGIWRWPRFKLGG